MKTKLIFSPLIKDDLKEIKDWYSQFDKKIFSKFLKEYRQKIRFISENPNSAEIRYLTNRISFLKTFPFGIHYEYFENQNIVTIFSVFHTSRNPKSGKKESKFLNP